MKYFILFYETGESFMERRNPLRTVHLNHVQKAFDHGHLIMGGAFSDPPGEAALIFNVDDVNIISDFAVNDPYVKQGLIKQWHIREWNVVVGNSLDQH